MSVPSVALSSVAAARNASTLLEAANDTRANSSGNDKPPQTAVSSTDDKKPVKAAVPPGVGKAIDISA